jgi:hypothetical protein
VQACTVTVETARERLVLSAVLACTFACRLDELIKSPRPAGLGVAPSRVAESAPVGSGSGSVPLVVSSARSDGLSWTAYRETGSAWIDRSVVEGAGRRETVEELTLTVGVRR